METLNFGNSIQKVRKRRYQSFLVLSNVTVFPYFVLHLFTVFISLLQRLQCVKRVRMWIFSGPYFSAFGLNTERYGVSLLVQSEYGKTRTRKILNTDTFYAVLSEQTKSWSKLYPISSKIFRLFS